MKINKYTVKRVEHMRDSLDLLVADLGLVKHLRDAHELADIGDGDPDEDAIGLLNGASAFLSQLIERANND